jgi:DNA-binding CsgD family transcriptional regulator
MFHALGLDASAEAVYSALLARPGSGVADLAGHLRLEDDCVREALDRLARLSLLRPSWDEPRTLRPVSPDAALEVLLARHEADLALREDEVVQARATAALLRTVYEKRQPTPSGDADGRMIGVDALDDRFRQLAREAAHEVISFVPGGEHSARSMLTSGPVDELLLERGLGVRTIYLNSVGNHPATSAYAHWLTDAGGQVRTVAALPIGMVIADRELALIPIDAEGSVDGGVLICSGGMVTALCALFDQTWAVARPLGIPEVPDNRGLTDQERELLRLLRLGHTDETVARKLGVSTRTSRRLAADLSHRLGARSRFEAGARAAELGWFRNP